MPAAGMRIARNNFNNEMQVRSAGGTPARAEPYL